MSSLLSPAIGAVSRFGTANPRPFPIGEITREDVIPRVRAVGGKQIVDVNTPKKDVKIRR